MPFACSQLSLVVLDILITRGGNLKSNTTNYRERYKWKFWRVNFKIVLFYWWLIFLCSTHAHSRSALAVIHSLRFVNSRSARIARFRKLTEILWSAQKVITHESAFSHCTTSKLLLKICFNQTHFAWTSSIFPGRRICLRLCYVILEARMFRFAAQS